MNKRVLIATLAGGVAFFLLGWLIMGNLLKDYYATHMTHYDGLMKPDDEFMKSGILFMFLSNIVGAYLLAIIFDRWANMSTFMGGLLGGFLVYFCFTLSMDLSMYSMMNIMDSKMVLIDSLVGGLLGGLVGGVVAFVLGMFPHKAD